MVFGLFGRKKKDEGAKAQRSPLAAFDAAIEELERQAAQLRRSAATLLALRGQLSRDVERYGQQRAAAEARLADAADPGVARVLARDQLEAARLAEVTQESLGRVDADARLLVEGAEELAGRLRELRLERQSAAARLRAGEVVSAALRQQLERFGQAMALDAARDEVERAHQLAQIYREERGR